MVNLKATLMESFGYSDEEADNEIAQARADLMDLISSGNLLAGMDFCENRWGLEPDYLDDLMF